MSTMSAIQNTRFWVFLYIDIILCICISLQVHGQKPGLPKAADLTKGICLPNPPSPLILSGPFTSCSDSVKNAIVQRHPDQNKNTPEILKTYKYPFETHNVTTKDGYILTTYRITGSPNSKATPKGKTKQAVYLNHGIGGASDTWNFQPGSRNLPFKLADAGYEVWLANARGTTYSLKHTKYNANTDLPYWNFTFHEMGVYDVPAITDKIISVSGNKKIFYVGYSMGSTEYFISLSEVPDMNKKLIAAFMFAPVAFIGHFNSVLRLVTPLLDNDPEYQVANPLFMGRVQSAQQIRTTLKISPGDFCDPTAAKCGVCDNLIFLLFGYDAEQINSTELPNMLAKYPNNFSLKTLAHYSQLANNCKFQQYDYGPIVNKKVYKTRSKNGQPPAYNLKNIKVPTYFFWGENDNIAQPNDVNITAGNLAPGVLKKSIKVQHKLFNHLDFAVAKDADRLVYDILLKELKTYSGK